MAFQELTRASVLAAIAEYDSLGQDAFLEKYGFRQATRYILVNDGRYYDSKAIVGAAYRYENGTALLVRDFSGGLATVVRLLDGLGFICKSTETTHTRP